MDIEYLPVYYPTQEEKDNPHIFAANVRRKMAHALNVPTSEFSVNDCLLQFASQKVCFSSSFTWLLGNAVSYTAPGIHKI